MDGNRRGQTAGAMLSWSSKMGEMIYGDGAIRRPGLYGSSIENTYAGVLSFMRRTHAAS